MQRSAVPRHRKHEELRNRQDGAAAAEPDTCSFIMAHQRGCIRADWHDVNSSANRTTWILWRTASGSRHLAPAVSLQLLKTRVQSNIVRVHQAPGNASSHAAKPCFKANHASRQASCTFQVARDRPAAQGQTSCEAVLAANRRGLCTCRLSHSSPQHQTAPSATPGRCAYSYSIASDACAHISAAVSSIRHVYAEALRFLRQPDWVPQLAARQCSLLTSAPCVPVALNDLASMRLVLLH